MKLIRTKLLLNHHNDCASGIATASYVQMKTVTLTDEEVQELLETLNENISANKKTRTD